MDCTSLKCDCLGGGHSNCIEILSNGFCAFRSVNFLSVLVPKVRSRVDHHLQRAGIANRRTGSRAQKRYGPILVNPGFRLIGVPTVTPFSSFSNTNVWDRNCAKNGC